ncbi:uncharacterized protein TNCV_1377191 [Trichonephila clavipes]|nr:uncharacterized protein TNCV_1377191 [Trichonephila clavipes]
MNQAGKHQKKKLHCCRISMTSDILVKFRVLHTKKNQKHYLNHPSTSFAVRQISENYAQNSSNPPLLSPELSPFPLSVRVLYPHCNNYQEPVPVECNQMKCSYNEMNPQCKPLTYRISPVHKILCEMDLNLGKYSIRNQTNLYSVDRSKTVCEEPKHGHNGCSFQKYVNIALKTQIERVNENKMAASNLSLLQFSNVYSNETTTEQNIFGGSLNNKNNEIGGDLNDKKTSRSGVVDEKFAGHLSSSGRSTDAGEGMEVCGAVETTFNVKSFLGKNLTTRTVEKPHVCDICKERFKYESLRPYLIHTTERLHVCVCVKSVIRDLNGNV